MKINDIITITIEKIGQDGDGIATIGNRKIYINNALPGEKVKAKIIDIARSYAHATLLEILTKSSNRIKAKCKHVSLCGGCQIQELKYNYQLQYKKQRIAESLLQYQLGNVIVYDTIGCKEIFRFRNKAIYPIAKSIDNRIITGFYARRSHNIIENSDCVIGTPENSKIIDLIVAHLNKYKIEPYNELTHSGIVRHVMIRKAFATGEIMVSIVMSVNNLPHSTELTKNLLENFPNIKSISLNINSENTNCIKGKEIINLQGNGYITDIIDGLKFKLSPLSFFQVNAPMTETLYNKVLEFCELTGEETIFDLYCGVGTISLYLARKAKKVYGVEIVPEAIADANENAKINNIDNAEFMVGKAEKIIPQLIESHGIKADIVIVDPPRKGCDNQLLKSIVKMKPRRMVYVSCYSETLSRDLKFMSDNGYTIQKIQPIDMFAHSVHVENVVALTN